MIKYCFEVLLNVFERRFFNKHYHTSIQSRKASLHAKYGKNVRIGKGSYIADDCVIGDYSYVNVNSSLEKCQVGKFCSISSGVYINPYEHNYHLKTTHPIIRNWVSDNSRPKVVIGNDVLISLNCVITSGVTIGDGAVVGAGAVVTKDVDPYEIVGGVPAKHIKWRFDEKTRNELLNQKWWDWEINKIKEEFNLPREE